ncbi:hypothetical protein M758_12G021400 [Ceratodon purpureus]|nr:hypothetical protein M758_12G021400 [Ceratodon purpureus]
MNLIHIFLIFQLLKYGIRIVVCITPSLSRSDDLCESASFFLCCFLITSCGAIQDFVELDLANCRLLDTMDDLCYFCSCHH